MRIRTSTGGCAASRIAAAIGFLIRCDGLGASALSAEAVSENRRRRCLMGEMADREAPRWVIVASGLAAFVGVLLVGAIVFSTVDRSPARQDELPSTVGAASPATLDQFYAAVRPPVEALLDAPGFEAVQTSFIGDYLASSVWLASSREGDFFALQNTDVNVTETAWWLLGDEPPSDDPRISTLVTVRIGDTVYIAPDPRTSGWNVDFRPDSPRGTTAIERALLSDIYEALLLPETSDATRQDLVGGGEVWAVTVPGDEGTSILRWFIDAGGKLAVYTGELVDARGSLAPENRIPIDSWVIWFTAVEDPAPIIAPDVDAPLDLSEFELPDDFPLGN
jgi:hypothetical protein